MIPTAHTFLVSPLKEVSAMRKQLDLPFSAPTTTSVPSSEPFPTWRQREAEEEQKWRAHAEEAIQIAPLMRAQIQKDLSAQEIFRYQCVACLYTLTTTERRLDTCPQCTSEDLFQMDDPESPDALYRCACCNTVATRDEMTHKDTRVMQCAYCECKHPRLGYLRCGGNALYYCAAALPKKR